MDGKHKNERAGSGVIAACREWIAPVAVAGILALAVAGTVELIDGTGRELDKRPTGTQTLLTTSNAKRPAPRFAVVVRRPGTALIVRDLRSGRILDETMPPPRGQRFHQVAATPNGAYIVSSYGRDRIAFYRLRLTGAGQAREFTALPRAVSGVSTVWSDMAISADGDRLAYVTYRKARARVDVLSLGSGAHRSWTTSLSGRIGSLSWVGDSLDFVWAPLRTPGAKTSARPQVRSLDTTGAAGDLRASRAVLSLPSGSAAAVVSRDGKTVVTGVSDRAGLALTAFSAADGRPGRVLRRFAGSAGLARLISDRTGGHLLAVSGDGQVYADSSRDLRAFLGGDVADVAW
jgi:uncharacterized protein YqjF (DUF2071 family)